MRLLLCGAALLALPSVAALAQTAEHGSAQTDTGKQDDAYFDDQVRKPARPRQGNPDPHYPDALLFRRESGEVIADFVVDTTGRVDLSTFQVQSKGDAAFITAVRECLQHSRFDPAEKDGRRVRQHYEHIFRFTPREN
jgi:protein TonB